MRTQRPTQDTGCEDTHSPGAIHAEGLSMARPVSSATQVVRVGVDCVLVGGALDTAKVHLPSVFSASVR